MKAIRIKKYVRFHSKEIIFLAALTIIGFFLRSHLLSENLFFGPEQGIDFLVVKNIVLNHNVTLIGAKTDISGIFHGPIYYYASVIPFSLSGSNPLVIAYFFIFINAVSVVFLYMLGIKLFNKSTAVISALLYTFSFGVIVYSRWLSTHPLVFPLSILFFYFMTDFLKGKKRSLLIAAVFAGLLTQAEFLNILFVAIMLGFLVIRFFKIFRKTSLYILILSALIFILLTAFHYLLFDVKHQWLISSNLLKLVTGDSGYYVSIPQLGLQVVSLTTSIMSDFLGKPLGILTVVLFLVSTIILYVKNKFNIASSIITCWLFIPLLSLLILRHEILVQYFVISIGAILLTVAYFLSFLYEKNRVVSFVLVVVLIGANLYIWKTALPNNDYMFFQAVQPDLRYKDQIETIKLIYQKSGNSPFSIQTYTIPYFSQQGWEYLFWYYGTKHEKQLPTPQEEKLFVIVQPDNADSSHQKAWLKSEVSKWGKEKNRYQVGFLTIKELNTNEK